MANVWTSSKSVSQVYVSGLPADVQLTELADLFTRYAGMIQEKPDGSPDIRLYMTEDNRIKGDCTINFVSKESVPQAIKLLDEYPIRENCNIAVQKAEFEQKSSIQHSTEELKALAESRATAASAKEDFRRNRKLANQRKLAWDSSSLAHGKHRRIVIVELPAFPSTQSFISKIHPVVERLGGPLSKITILEGNRVALKFKEIVAAQRCLETMDNGLCSTIFPEVFPGNEKVLTAFFFSGESFTPVEVQEEEAEAESEDFMDEAEIQRMENYQKWLDEVSSDSDMEIKCESGSE